MYVDSSYVIGTLLFSMNFKVGMAPDDFNDYFSTILARISKSLHIEATPPTARLGRIDLMVTTTPSSSCGSC